MSIETTVSQAGLLIQSVQEAFLQNFVSLAHWALSSMTMAMVSVSHALTNQKCPFTQKSHKTQPNVNINVFLESFLCNTTDSALTLSVIKFRESVELLGFSCSSCVS